jgi:pimeloyl-ACP methyl ester carboxylesterase
LIKKILLGALALLILVNLTFARPPDKPPAAGKFVEVDGLRIHYKETPGRGIPVVMIHGMPGTWLDWQEVVPKLDGIRTIAIDRPGYGWSEGGWVDYQQQIEVVHDMLGKLGIERAVVVGHSFGGALTVGLARKHPEDVVKMILVAPAGGELRIPAIAEIQAYAIKALGVPVVEQVSDIVFSNVMRRISAGIGAEQAFAPDPVNDVYKQRLLAVTMTDENLASLADDRTHYNSEVGPWLDAAARQVRTPGVEIAARDDKLVSFENAKILDGQLRNSTLIPVGGGHMVVYSHPDVIAEQIKRAVRARVASR